jgi:hypothetical protein
MRADTFSSLEPHPGWLLACEGRVLRRLNRGADVLVTHEAQYVAFISFIVVNIAQYLTLY